MDTMTTPKTFSMILPVTIVLVIASIVAVIFLMKKEEKIDETKFVKSVVLQQDVTGEVAEEKTADSLETVEVSATETIVEQEDPHTAFPSMMAEAGDADAELASAFTYENLQDSMLTSGREAREAVKSRAAWSRFGERANPEVWEEQMQEMKREIKASGQTLEQFMENSWAPIPEQMASFWKDSASSEQMPEIKTEIRASRPSRVALSEAPALTRDATQPINTTDTAVALERMNEILSARKRAKALKLRIPELSEEQKKDIQHWSNEENKSVSGIARALASM